MCVETVYVARIDAVAANLIQLILIQGPSIYRGCGQSKFKGKSLATLMAQCFVAGNDKE
jgi:isocitrate lyase